MEVSLHRRHPTVFRAASCVVHAAGAVHFVFGCYYDWFEVDIPKEVSPIFSAFGYKLKFLTYWDALLQAAYFILCLVNDILGPQNKETKEPTKLCKVKDFIECSIAFPIAGFVAFTFWGLMAVDRELVLPAALDPYFPRWLNHVMHTNIVLFQLLEVVTSRREYPARKWGLLGLSLFEGTYLTWMHIVYLVSGLWVYPIFNVLALPARILFLIGSFVTGYAFYFLGEYLNRLLWEVSLPNHSSKIVPKSVLAEIKQESRVNLTHQPYYVSWKKRRSATRMLNIIDNKIMAMILLQLLLTEKKNEKQEMQIIHN